MTQAFEHPVDQGEDRRRRAEVALDRQVEELSVDGPRLALEPGNSDLEMLRIGALKAEDRLLEIADREDRAGAIRGAFPGKIFIGKRAYDVPLPVVGVLGLIDQD